MKQWFDRLPIHRKLVASALLITAVALALATMGLGIYDTWRYRTSASADADALARVLAENLSAAVMFSQPDVAQETLRSVRVRQVVTRVCVYHLDGQLFASFSRDGAPCPATGAGPWRGVVGHAAVVRNDRTYGSVYLERDLSDLWGRLMVTAFAGLLMFAFAASAAYLLAQRVNAGISRPITALAGYARAFGDDPQTTEPPPVRTSPDELGDLVTAFRDMVQRVQTANDDLRRSNEALRHEQSEREAALARERRANLLKDEFLAAVSHELRTPLNAMMGWAQILARANPTPDMVERAVTSIVKNAQAQMRVIEDLLDVSRIVTGKLRLRFAKVDLRLVVASAVESMEPVAATRGLSLTTALPEEPCIVAGDRDRLQQVLWNLVSNAVKFTPRGGRVEVRLTAEDHRYRVQVSDTGIGIPAEFVPYVFERFRQADGSMTREHGGLGLGLAIVKELTELHGGAVAAASAGPDQGSQFSVILPQCDPETAHGREAGRPAADLPTLDGVRAFVVDDNEDAVAIAATALTCAGATVQGFTNPETALSAWEREAPDVLVCDLAMPRMSGLDLLGRAREIDAARGAFTPGIAISAHATEQHRADSLRAGFHAHLGKPIDPDDLVRAVADALDAQ